MERRISQLVRRPAALALLVMCLAGCGGGGGSASSAASSPDVTAGGKLGSVTMTVTRSTASSTRDVPSNTTSIRVTVLGTNIVQIVPFPPGTAAISVQLDNVPIGPQSILVEALDGTTVVASNIIQVTVVAGTSVGTAATLVAVNPSPSPAVSPNPSPSPNTSPSPASSPSPTASPSPTPLGSLVFSIQPPSRVASGFDIGAAVQVQALTSSGAVDTNFSSPITLSIAPATATLSSASLTATPVHGVATFSNLTVTGPPGSYVLGAIGGPLSTQSAPFVVVTAHLRLVDTPAPQQSVNTAMIRTFGAGTSFNVEVDDVNNQPIVNAGGNIAMSLVSPQAPPASFGLVGQPPSGTVIATLINGVATFDNLAVSGVASDCMLRAVGGGQNVQSSLFAVGPKTAGGAAFICGATGPMTGQITRQSLDDFSFTGVTTMPWIPQVMNVVTPTSGPSAGVPFLFVAGDDAFLHVYTTDTLVEQAPSIGLGGGGVFVMMRNESGVIYAANQGSGDIYLVDVSSYTPGGIAPISTDIFVGGVQGLAMDPRAAPNFWLAMHSQGGPPQFLLDTYLPGTFMSVDSYSDNHTAVFHGYTDTATTDGVRVVALETSGNTAPLPDLVTSTLSSYDPGVSPIPLQPYGSNIRGAVQPVLNDVAFYTTGTNPALALMADAGGGATNGVDLVSVSPGAPMAAPVINSVTSCLDNLNVLATSNPQTINIVYNGTQASHTPAIGLVLDASGEIFELDLTAATPTVYASFGPYSGFTGSTTFTVYQPGFQLSR